MHWFSIQVQPVGDFCNIACLYCPFGLVPNGGIMTDAVLEALVIKLLAHNEGHGVFCWHGGEPTLAGVGFFEKAIALQNRYALPGNAVNAIQTNAVQAQPDIATLFAEHNFSVGVSLDGPEFVHNTQRKNKASANTHALVLRGIDVYRRAGNTPSVICTVTKNSLPYASEIFHHLVEQGFTSLSFNAAFRSFPNTELAITNEEWYGFLRIIFREWFEMGNEDIEVREINEVVSWINDNAGSSCTTLGTCAHWLSMDHQGNLYPCQVLERNPPFGNILQVDFSNVHGCQTHQELVKIAAYRPVKCRQCQFLQLCNNGCVGMREDATGAQSRLGLYAYCEQRLALFREVQQIFSSHLE